MERKHMIIIVGLIIVIIALIAGLAMTIGNNSSKGVNVPENMQKYDFNSEFKMAVPKNAKFLKEWNYTNPFFGDGGYSYFDKDNEFGVRYMDTPLITHEFVRDMLEAMNKSEDCTFERDGDLIICHNSTANGEVGKNMEDSNFNETIIIQKGHLLVRISGNDLGFIKSMANSIEFYE